MSWDVLMQDFNGVDDIENLPDDFEPKPLGPRNEIIAKIKSIFPDVDFTDPDWGVLHEEEFSIEFNMDSDPVESIMFHVRGEESAVTAINKLIFALGQQALDTTTGKFIDPHGHTEGMAEWRKFRDEVMGSLNDEDEG